MTYGISGLLALGLLAPAGAPDDDAGALASAAVAVEKVCFECHGAGAAKGGLRLHEAAGWISEVDPADVESSELLYRLTLEPDDPEAMPPEGPRLSSESIDAIRAWITAGADEETLEGAMALASARTARRAAAAEAVSARSGARVDVIEADGEFVGYSVSWSHRPAPPTREGFVSLEAIGEDVVELSLAGTAFDPGWLPALPALERLVALDLARTEAGDAALAHLIDTAPALRRANLTSTRVTAAGIRAARAKRPDLALIYFDTPAAPPVTDPFAAVGAHQPRRILAGDASKRRVALLREIAIGKPEMIWERSVESMHDLQWLGESEAGGGHGRVLVQETWTRIVEVDTASGEVLWSYDAAPAEGESVEVHSFQRLEDGTTMVAESGRGRVAFVDSSGAVQGSFSLTLDRPHPHHDTRLVRPTGKGTFLVAHERDGVVREYDREGRVVWSFDVPLFDEEPRGGHGFDAFGDQVFCALRLPGGDTLVSTGNGHGLLRVNPAGEVRQRIAQESLEGVRLAWTTAVQVLSNGHVVLGNCHAGPEQPQAIEIDLEAGEVVWRFRDHDRFGDALSNLLVIERSR